MSHKMFTLYRTEYGKKSGDWFIETKKIVSYGYEFLSLESLAREILYLAVQYNLETCPISLLVFDSPVELYGDRTSANFSYVLYTLKFESIVDFCEVYKINL